ncbi:MAG: hypothetical protein UHN41_01145 [Bacteroidales bacterium]|nr:hypothetical protein [Bacteroidales bacterium]
MKIKETLDVIEQYNNNLPEEGTVEQLNIVYLAGIATFLADISKSLAIIADSSEVGKMLIEQSIEEER